MASAVKSVEEKRTKLCTKCGVNPQAWPESSNHWCTECDAVRKVEWAQAREERAVAQGFAAGVSAMRYAVAGRFRAFGTAHFSGAEIAAKVEQLEAPPRPPTAS